MKRILVLIGTLWATCAAWATPWIGAMQIIDSVRPGTTAGNYGLVQYFIDEDKGERIDFTVEVEVYPDTATISAVKLWSNLNRRDYATMYERFEDGDTPTSYYQSHDMVYDRLTTDGLRHVYRTTLSATQCGIYRVSGFCRATGTAAPYWINDCEDGGQAQRDCVIVVSPKKALRMRMYEANVMTVEAEAGGTRNHRSTLEDLTDHEDDSFDPFNLDYVRNILGFNALWLMPIHPVGEYKWWPANEATAYDMNGVLGGNLSPGSPYAIRDYWAVNTNFTAYVSPAALTEFLHLVDQAESLDLNIFLDVAMNHGAWDCAFGQGGVDLGYVTAANATDWIRLTQPAWCTRGSDWITWDGDGYEFYYHLPALYSSWTSFAPADRLLEHNWEDAGCDWYYGNYSALGCPGTMGLPDGDTGSDDTRDLFWSWTSPDATYGAYEQAGATAVWDYFAYYVPYWLQLTGNQLDGIRADVAWGLPSQAWEYIVNVARTYKWDFIFLAEGLDNQNSCYRVRRCCDLMTTIRHGDFRAPVLSMSYLYNLLEDEPSRYGRNVSMLWNSLSHDEEPGAITADGHFLRYAICASLYGVPMVYQSQPLGFPRKLNFESAWDGMAAYWADSRYNNPARNERYRRMNEAREGHPALRDVNRYFLQRYAGGGFNEELFAMARWSKEDERAEWNILSYSSGDKDLVFIRLGNALSEHYAIPAEFPLQPTTTYYAYNLMADTPDRALWRSTGADLKANGMHVVFDAEEPVQVIHLEPVFDLVDWFPEISDLPEACAAEAIAAAAANPSQYTQALADLRQLEQGLQAFASGASWSRLYRVCSPPVIQVLLNPRNLQLKNQALLLLSRAAFYARQWDQQQIDMPLAETDRLLVCRFLAGMVAQTADAPACQATLRELKHLAETSKGLTFSTLLERLQLYPNPITAPP